MNRFHVWLGALIFVVAVSVLAFWYATSGTPENVARDPVGACMLGNCKTGYPIKQQQEDVK